MGGLHESRVLTISNRADVERAVASATWLSRPRVGAVHVAIEGVDRARAAAHGARIGRLYNDCGSSRSRRGSRAADLQITVFEELGDEAPWPFRLGCRDADV